MFDKRTGSLLGVLQEYQCQQSSSTARPATCLEGKNRLTYSVSAMVADFPLGAFRTSSRKAREDGCRASSGAVLDLFCARFKFRGGRETRLSAHPRSQTLTRYAASGTPRVRASNGPAYQGGLERRSRSHAFQSIEGDNWPKYMALIIYYTLSYFVCLLQEQELRGSTG